MTQGIVFDIQRFSLYDGPGIRTTVFLKGCPLKCIWCHNPESQNYKVELSFKSQKCVHCGTCEAVCPEKVHKISRDYHIINWNRCTGCGKCVTSCAYDALKLYGRAMSVQEVIQEILKDMDYYRNSGGGLTVSGGEPLAQPEFTIELLKAAKDANIHTCIETSGYVQRKVIEETDQYVDLYLLDYKSTNSQTHKELTGVSNELMLSNLQFLYERGSSIIIRCPLIPGINDSEEHLAGIADLSKRFPMIKAVELLPYHDMGKGKYGELGIEYSLSYLKNTDEDQKSKWMEYFNSAKCKNVKFGW